MSTLRWLKDQSGTVIAVTVLAALAALALSFWLLFSVVRPAPPRSVTMMTGTPGGGYEMFAERYRAALERAGVELVLRPSSGSVENLRALKTDPTVDLAFIQSGIAHEPESTDLVSLGSMYFEPAWIFHRLDTPLTWLAQLDGKRVAMGEPGSGTHLLALQMLAASGIPLNADGLTTIGGEEATRALLDGHVDALFVISGVESPIVRTLLHAPRIELAELTHTPAYARRMPHLETVVLPAGSVDLVDISPPRDVTLLGATANLVARSDLHPAIISLLLQAARDIHGGPGLFQRAGDYPALLGRDLPPSNVAQRLYDSGPPFLQRYLPFWLAILVDRLLVALLPLIAIMIPLMRILPALYSWRMRSRIYRWYGELKFLERRIGTHSTDADIDDYIEQLDRIEERANHRRIPLSYNSELYTLREHIQLVRARLQHLKESHDTAAAE
ncbi:MAG: TAXI family TRAP transporter solute-binding subunit [Phycisphaerales bacterium JB058]